MSGIRTVMRLSAVHDWQGDPAVKQMLLWPSAEAQLVFEAEMRRRVAAAGPAAASDTGIGAMYKIRALRGWDNTWAGVVRCGHTGFHLLGETAPATTWQLAMLEAYNLLQQYMGMPLPVAAIRDPV